MTHRSSTHGQSFRSQIDPVFQDGRLFNDGAFLDFSDRVLEHQLDRAKEAQRVYYAALRKIATFKDYHSSRVAAAALKVGDAVMGDIDDRE